jgi:hypothetical protein
MTAFEVKPRIEELQALIEVKEAELAQKANRRREISSRPTANKEAQRSFIARLKTEMIQLTEELNNYKTELWGLQELNLPES